LNYYIPDARHYKIKEEKLYHKQLTHINVN
jgi:hypothetical protein